MKSILERVFALLPLLCLFWAPTADSEDETSWQRFRSEEAGFEIELPSEPSHEFSRRWTIAGRLSHHHYSVRHPRANFDIERIEMPAVAVYFLSADSLLDRARDDLMADLDGLLDDEERLEIRAFPARRLYFRRPDVHPHPEECLLVLVGRFLYLVTAGPYEAPYRNALVEPFFASFEFCVDEVAPCGGQPVRDSR